jgi:hypothetical protein
VGTFKSGCAHALAISGLTTIELLGIKRRFAFLYEARESLRRFYAAKKQHKGHDITHTAFGYVKKINEGNQLYLPISSVPKKCNSYKTKIG